MFDQAFNGDRSGRGATSRSDSRRRRRRDHLAPDAESLEVRDCPSGLASHLAYAETAHALAIRHQVAIHHSHQAVAAKKIKSTGPQTIYVAPRGRLGFTAGKNAAHPLGSLKLAFKRARPGTTIVLAPGVYTQNAGLISKANITIVGAPNQSSILAPATGQALKVYASSGITINGLWFRSAGNGGAGLAIGGSSVNLVDVRTDGTYGSGVIVTGYGGQSSVVSATSSQFDAVQTGDGMDVQDGSTVTIGGCTFNGDGTAGGAIGGGSGLSVEGNSQVTIANSQFVGNLNANLVAYQQAQVTAQGSTFSSSRNGDGALFSGQAAVSLTGDTFASNGTVVGYGTGFNGVEFYGGYSGAAALSGNTFVDNTADGIFVGSAAQSMQITNNIFNGNLVGLDLDASQAAIDAVVQGNTFTVASGTSSAYQGLVAAGSGVTATVGGTGGLQNVFENYSYQTSILQFHSNGTSQVGCPNLSILGNSYLQNGRSVDPSQAVLPC